MIRIFKIFCFLMFSATFVSCEKTEEPEVIPFFPYEYQYPFDIANIETFLKTHSYTATAPNFDITFAIVASGDPTSIWGSNPSTPKASLLNKMVLSNGVNYKVYYLSLQEGVKDSPTSVDNIVVNYKGQLLTNDTPVFDDKSNENTSFLLSNALLIQGWKAMFPLFKSGNSIPNPDGTVSYNNFGVGIMFLPSGLSYYNQSPTSKIPAFSSLIFTIKLKEVNYVDNEADNILTKFEDLNNDGNPFNDDSDGDNVPNFADIDDDADYLPTLTEIKRPARDVSGDIVLDPVTKEPVYVGYYPYNGALLDNPLTTTIDERQGIPRKFTGPLRYPSLPESATNRRRPLPSDYTDPLRLRRHIDASCIFPYESPIIP
jgi:FKBP-type peptidyl-prolyl cis-trans isomerase FkpA